MNHFKIYFLSVLLLSCTGELPDAPEQTVQELGTPVTFSYSIEPEVTVETRTILPGSEFPAETQENKTYVGVFALRGTGTGESFVPSRRPQNLWEIDNFQTHFFNAKYDHVEKTQTSGQTTIRTRTLVSLGEPGLMPEGDERLRFFAYYPYVDDSLIDYSESNPKSPKLDVALSPDLTQSIDYLYTGFIDDYDKQKSVPISFKHVLARFQIFLKANKDIPPFLQVQVQGFKIMTWSAQEGKLNFETGYLEPKQTSYNYNFTYNYQDPITLSSTEYSSDNPQAEMLFFPNYDDNGSKITSPVIYSIVMKLTDNKEYTIYQHTTNDEIKLQRGKITRFYLTFNYSS